MPKYETFYTEDGAEVQAYKVEEPHQVGTIAGPRDVGPGVYVVQRDRPELVDVFPADQFEAEHSKNEPSDTDTEDVSAFEQTDDTDSDVEDDTDSDVEEYDPTQHTVAEVQEYIKAHPDQRDTVLRRERAGANRQSLVS